MCSGPAYSSTVTGKSERLERREGEGWEEWEREKEEERERDGKSGKGRRRGGEGWGEGEREEERKRGWKRKGEIHVKMGTEVVNVDKLEREEGGIPLCRDNYYGKH